MQVFYFVWGNCLVAFGFLMSTIFTNLKTAVVVGEPLFSTMGLRSVLNGVFGYVPRTLLPVYVHF